MKSFKTILIIDDEASMRKNINDILSLEGYNILEAENGLVGLDIALSHDIDLILLDCNMPVLDGFASLSELKLINPDRPVIMLTAYGTNERVIEAIKKGAYDYIEKPFELSEFLIVIERAINYFELLKELKLLRTQISIDTINLNKDQIIGKSPQMKEILKVIGLTAHSNANILIQGDSGTGKELIADAIQRHSLRKDNPYIKINCGAFTESLLESEIFGHEKGAFTGATSQKLGRFELANEGTIFLDEINNMSHSLQIRLLRILQHQSFFRVGGETPVPVNTRIIAASNVNIEKEVDEGRLRKDLYYRLNVIRINIPPLRERIEDIPLLVDHFLKNYAPNRNFVVTEENIGKLKNGFWHGNVRELENNIQRAIVMARENFINIETSEEQIKSDTPNSPFEKISKHGTSLKNVVEEFEKSLITRALIETNGNRSEAAKLLKMHRRLLYTKIKEYKIATL